LGRPFHSEEDILDLDITDIPNIADLNHDLGIVHVGILGA